MLVISGEPSWQGYTWALKVEGDVTLLGQRAPMTWFRSTVGDFPLVGVSRQALIEYIAPRPHKREEILIFGGVLELPDQESQVRA